MTLQTDISYRPDSERGLLDVMIPDGAGPFPVVVCIHGGGWAGGKKDMLYPYGEILQKMGIASVFPLYRVTSTDAHPAQEEDIFAVLGWIAYHSRDYPFDIGRIGLTGASAGGHLSALVGLKATRMHNLPYTVRCILPVCPVTDLTAFLRDNPNIRDVLEALVGGKIEENEARMRDASPVTHVHRHAPPCLCAHGGADGVVPHTQSLELVEALAGLGAQAEAIIVPGVGHAAFMPDSEPPEPLGGRKAFEQFFRKHLLEAAAARPARSYGSRTPRRRRPGGRASA